MLVPFWDHLNAIWHSLGTCLACAWDGGVFFTKRGRSQRCFGHGVPQGPFLTLLGLPFGSPVGLSFHTGSVTAPLGRRLFLICLRNVSQVLFGRPQWTKRDIFRVWRYGESVVNNVQDRYLPVFRRSRF